ncbi:MAG TPA: hypothetical protein VFA51_03200, partial [Candidatus Udaeobacter sp.]|nr:hypothetical protein [Candidatus Udaeobacter sp.]
RKCPGDTQILRVINFDLIQPTIARVLEVFGRHRPLPILPRRQILCLGSGTNAAENEAAGNQSTHAVG